MSPAKISETIKAREAEMASVRAAFTARKAATQKIVDEYQTFGAECQLKVTHLEGCIAELKRQLPKTSAEKKAERKKKK